MTSTPRTILVFATVGALVVPIALTLAGWTLRWLLPEAAGAAALLHDVRLSLWPMSRLFDAPEASRHWLYLPLAALLSNALIYAMVGALAAWGRVSPPALVAAVAAAIGVAVGAHLALDTSLAGTAVAVVLAVTALVAHHVARRRAT